MQLEAFPANTIHGNSDAGNVVRALARLPRQAPLALGHVGLLVWLGKPESHLGNPDIQGHHLVGLIGPALEGGFSPVAEDGPGHYGRLPKDPACAIRC